MQQDSSAETCFEFAPGLPYPAPVRGNDPAGHPPPLARGRYEGEAAMAACDGIIDFLAAFFNVSGRELRSPSRTQLPVARVRQLGMYIAHVTLGIKMSEVGEGFGRDKSTVVHACHTIEDLREDEEFDMVVAHVERLVAVAFSLDVAPGRRDE
ncbi:helix-turn-helix domain-containing protein [Oricola thermophila]|nr:helix-turn-helix domain-containing protein [Oricola thermophila]